jgi:hypothetical protein
MAPEGMVGLRPDGFAQDQAGSATRIDSRLGHRSYTAGPEDLLAPAG